MPQDKSDGLRRQRRRKRIPHAGLHGLWRRVVRTQPSMLLEPTGSPACTLLAIPRSLCQRPHLMAPLFHTSGAEQAGGASLARLLVPTSLWRPAASSGAAQQQASGHATIMLLLGHGCCDVLCGWGERMHALDPDCQCIDMLVIQAVCGALEKEELSLSFLILAAPPMRAPHASQAGNRV
eukprot:1160046-Pelagomonas_calceolata.AAC.8